MIKNKHPISPPVNSNNKNSNYLRNTIFVLTYSHNKPFTLLHKATATKQTTSTLTNSHNKQTIHTPTHTNNYKTDFHSHKQQQHTDH